MSLVKFDVGWAAAPIIPCHPKPLISHVVAVVVADSSKLGGPEHVSWSTIKKDRSLKQDHLLPPTCQNFDLCPFVTMICHMSNLTR